MRINHLCVLMHFRIRGKVGTVKRDKPSSNLFTDHLKVVLLSWSLFVIYVSCVSFLYCIFSSWQPCGHLLGKG